MPIDHIRVKNFRSLADVAVDAKSLTVFVGCNDEGKSNLLRALDLFFNSGMGGYSISWFRDYSGYAKAVKNKAPQIEISLTFTLPSSFNVDQKVVWKKVWRQTGFHAESINLADGSSLPPRSKVYAYLKAMRYEYVPAIKGPEYFERLLGSVHDMLDATVQTDIRTAAADFTAEIRRHTKDILADLEKLLGLKSDLELPSDLRRLFTELEFQSTVGDRRVALSERGDGIKVRHIPIILRWLAQQANHLSAPGRPRVVTIWGYEEPENNLETRRGFELADFFLGNSSLIQTFLTTHSPVFYSVLRPPSSNQVALAEVKLDSVLGTQVMERSSGKASDVEALHSSMGFLDLLEPHVRNWKERVDRLQSRIDEGVATDRPTVFVEGPTDRTVITAVIKRYFDYATSVRVSCSTSNGGGHSWVKDSLIAWHHSRPRAKAVGLFDGDAAAGPSVDEFRDLIEARFSGRTMAFKHRLKATGLALDIYRAGLKLPIALEELYPREAWEYATKMGWLEDRPGLTQLYGFQEVDVTFNNWLAEKLPDNVLYIIARNRVREEFKGKLANYVSGRLADSACGFDFQPLIQLVDLLLKRLDVKRQEVVSQI